MANFQVLRLLARARLGVRDSGGLELVLSTDELRGFFASQASSSATTQSAALQQGQRSVQGLLASAEEEGAEFIRYTASGMVYSLQIVLLLVDGIVQTVGNEPSQRNVSGVCLRGTLLCL
ncbi:unnamed protein product [Durusdinium trenchii]|uniref:Coatomer subunit zeta n=1 Tax=Durusdinium trenchii TaxID=1381693 RepID=A0ABP0HT94_9DINO